MKAQIFFLLISLKMVLIILLRLIRNFFKKVVRLVEKTIRTLGINYGSAKGDIIIHEGKPFILEMACRTSGGWFCAGSIPAATGINALNPLIKIAVGDTPDLSLQRQNIQKGVHKDI